MNTTERRRSPAEVLDEHLRESQTGSIDDDRARNYLTELVVLSVHGIHRGRVLNRLLAQELPNAKFEYCSRLAVGEIALLEWRATADGTQVNDGANTASIPTRQEADESSRGRSLCGREIQVNFVME